MIKCDYCNNEFSTQNVLKIHQKSAKYCLILQEKDKSDNVTNLLICEFCNKTFTRKDVRNIHILSCKKKIDVIHEKDKLIEELKNKILELEIQHKDTIFNLEKKIVILETRLEDREEMSGKFEILHSKKDNCIEKIALQPKISTTKTTSNTQNNILNNLPVFNLTKEKLQLIASTEFTHELFLRGQEGAAKFATNIARKENDGDLPWVVSDKNRGIVKMKGEDGIIITDYDVEIITDLIFEAIKDKNQEYFDAAYPPYDSDAEELDPDEAERVEANKARADKCFSDIAKMKRNNKVFKKKLIEYSL